jgi:hypothetical protein
MAMHEREAPQPADADAASQPAGPGLEDEVDVAQLDEEPDYNPPDEGLKRLKGG